MRDPRFEKLAKLIVNHSVSLQKDEHVLIRADIEAIPFVKVLIKEIYKAQAIPHVRLSDEDINREVLMNVNDKYFDKVAAWNKQVYEDIDASITIVAEKNDSASQDVPFENKLLAAKRLRPVSDIIINQKKWTLLNYPTHGLAQKAKMSYEAFFDYLFDVCTVDYQKMEKAFKPLKELMEKTDKVRIVGPGTDLTFSIKGISAIPCYGTANIPDGEIFTAPVKDSVNGVIRYNTPSPYHGIVFNNIEFTFENGKIVKATADNHQEKLEEILNTDEGARYIGEFAIGVNPLILHPIGDILFDEKIAGSLHFTPGQCYKDEADNGNESAIHWDLVLIQREEYGGGQIYFDDVLIRDNGIFVLDSLKGLNPENLK